MKSLDQMARVRGAWCDRVIRQLQYAAGDLASREGDVNGVFERLTSQLPRPETPMEQLLLDGLIARVHLVGNTPAERVPRGQRQLLSRGRGGQNLDRQP